MYSFCFVFTPAPVPKFLMIDHQLITTASDAPHTAAPALQSQDPTRYDTSGAVGTSHPEYVQSKQQTEMAHAQWTSPLRAATWWQGVGGSWGASGVCGSLFARLVTCVVWCCGRFLWCYAWVQPCCGILWLTRVLRLYDPWLFGESLRTGLFSTDSQRDPEGTVYAATQASPCIYMSHMGMLQMTRAVGTPGTSRTVAIHKIGETAWQAYSTIHVATQMTRLTIGRV